MVSIALQSLAGEKGSSESAISAAIQSTFDNLPWAHDRLLPYYLRKLVTAGELASPSPNHYQFPLQPPPSPVRRRGRPRLHPSNPNPNPKPRLTLRHRGRSRPHRRRGRPRKISVEDKLLAIEEKGLPPVRPARGRSRLRRGTQRLGLGCCDAGKEQFLGERSDFDTAKSGKVLTFLASEFFEHDVGKAAQGEAIATEIVHEKLVEGTSLLSDEQHDVGKPVRGEAIATEVVHERLVEGTSEFFEHDVGKPEVVHEKLVEGSSLLSDEHHGNERGMPLVAAEESKDGHFQSVPGVGNDDSMVEEVVVISLDEEQVVHEEKPRKKRRLEGKRRSLRLWFES